MIGTTAALIGMAVASGGSKIAGSVIEGRASKKAANVQQQAAKQAQDYYNKVWGGFQQQVQPYLDVGRNATNLLGSLMTPRGGPMAPQLSMPYGAPPRMGPAMPPGGPNMMPMGPGGGPPQLAPPPPVEGAPPRMMGEIRPTLAARAWGVEPQYAY